jgi:hypothetical protein
MIILTLEVRNPSMASIINELLPDAVHERIETDISEDENGVQHLIIAVGDPGETK